MTDKVNAINNDDEVLDVEWADPTLMVRLPLGTRLTPEQIIEQFSEGAPSWMEAHGNVCSEHERQSGTPLNNYKDVVLVTPERVECSHYPTDVSEATEPVTPLSFGQINFGWGRRTNDPTHTAWLYWRYEDWRIAQELIAKMWGVEPWELYDSDDCPNFPDEEAAAHERAALWIEAESLKIKPALLAK